MTGMTWCAACLTWTNVRVRTGPDGEHIPACATCGRLKKGKSEMMDPNQAAADIEDALGLIKGAREDVESIESDAINWGDSSGTVEDAASAARDALDRLISALASALDQLPGDD